MSDFIEDVGYSNEVFGPVISQHYGVQRFSIDFKNSIKWLTDPNIVLPEKLPASEMHRKFLHAKLDEYLDRYIKEHIND